MSHFVSKYYITAAIEVTAVLVKVLPSDDNVIPVVLQLEDDTIIEPTDLYQLMIANFSDPRAVAGDVDTSYVIINDDDGKLLYRRHIWYNVSKFREVKQQTFEF